MAVVSLLPYVGVLANESLGLSVVLLFPGNPNMYSGRYNMYWNWLMLSTLLSDALMNGKM